MPGFLEPGGTGTRIGHFFVVFSGVCSLVATFLSIISTWLQLKNYRKPLLQRYVVRILLMVPIYAISSWLSIESATAAFFLDPVRDIYEAFTIYTFFQLLINFLGGERALIILTHGRAPTPHLWPFSSLPGVDISDPHTFLIIKRGILQYTWLKPVLAVATIIMKATDTYQEGYIGLKSGYLWSGIAYNLSVTISLYSLGMFWACMHQDLKPFRPVPKFLCVKLIIFASYWQGFFLSILVWLKLIPDTAEYTRDNLAAAIQDTLICIEMPAFAIAHWYAFSWKDYADPTISAARMPIPYAFRDAYGVRDLIYDTKMTFVGKGYEYRNFDSADGDTMAHPESSARMARIMEGMRYERGGKGKYWIPKPATSNRTPLLGAAGAAAGLDDPAKRLAANAGNSYGSTSENELDNDSMDEETENLYTDARAMEFGDYNYPVITAHEAYDVERFRANYQSRHLVTTATNQALLKPENRSQLQPQSRSSSSRSESRKGKGKASDDEESQGLLAKATHALKRNPSSSSHISDRSGIVDLVVEDEDAEEIERVRARKEGGPGWNDEDPKIFVTKYPPKDAGEYEQRGFESEHLPPPVDTREHHTDNSKVGLPRRDTQDNFVVAEDDDNDDDDESPTERRDKLRYGSLADDDNPWGR